MISAVEGVQKQTIEVLDIIKASNIPFIVAINKVDSPAAEPDDVHMQLAEHDVETIELGGDVPTVHISAKSGLNLDKLLDILKEETLGKLDLKENFEGKARSFVVESGVDDSMG